MRICIRTLLPLLVALAIVLPVGTSMATPPPPDASVTIPAEIAARLRAYRMKGGFLKLTQATQKNRADLKAKRIDFLTAQQRGDTRVSGTRAIPVLLAIYRNTAAKPYPAVNLQTQLFGNWPTGSMTDYYREVSYGAFTVTGTVREWAAVSGIDTEYEGPDSEKGHCNGLCARGNVARLIRELIEANDATIDFAQFDNDGPDGKPNSGDDNGQVDFIALVHPESGGECLGSSNIWSHRYSYNNLTGTTVQTKDVGISGRRIVIDDYVIMPALACDNKTMIQIGVFAHEFGHAFGLPDLYDTDNDNGKSSGIGTWGLMGSGSWGGNGNTPSRPSHMSVWEKDFLGWIDPVEISQNASSVSFATAASSPFAAKVSVSNDLYYLIENRTRMGFDNALTGDGLLVWRVRPKIIADRIRSNSVNADSRDQGLKLIEADGLGELDQNQNRGNFGDMFRGSAGKTRFDSTTLPVGANGFAICNVGPPGPSNTVSILFNLPTCP